MRLLVLTDVHSVSGNVKEVREKFMDFGIDAVVVCGDFSNEGTVSVAKDIVSFLDFARVFAVPGNMDSVEIISFLEEKGISIHKKRLDFKGYSFMGFGGAKPVNTFYRVNHSESEAKKYLERISEGLDNRKTILVTHAPPQGTRLSISSSGIDIGTIAIREFIESFQPLLSLCGHVHESAGKIELGKTVCFNPGALKDGWHAVVEISGDGKLSFRRDCLGKTPAGVYAGIPKSHLQWDGNI